MSIPVQATTFIGRERDLESVTAALRDDGVRLLTVTGPPGVGKTRLAVEAGHRLRDSFEHGVHFASLAPLQDPDLVAPAIVRALGLSSERKRKGRLTSLARDQLAEYLRNKQALLVLDNFEHLLPAAALIAYLLDASHGLRILVTSREALKIDREREVLLRPLPVPTAGESADLAALQTQPSVALFLERARSVSPDLALTQANAGAVVEICRRLDGLPLALELGAGRMRTLSPNDLAAHLVRPFDLLVSRRSDSPPRQRSLFASIAWSYQLLNDQERRAFRRLAVFRGGFLLDAAQGIIRPDSPSALIDILSSLVEKSLLMVVPGRTGSTRYAFLASLREFAALELEAAGESEGIHTALAAMCLSLAEEAATACNGPDQASWFDKIEEELDNIRSALHWTVAHDPVIALRITLGLQWFWEARGHFIEAHRWYGSSLEKAAHAPPALLAQALAAHGLILWYLDIEESVSTSTRGLELARASADHIAEAFCLRNLGLAALEGGDFATTERCYAERLALHTRYGPRWAVANTLNHMAALARVTGDIARSADLARQNLEISRPLGHKRVIALGLASLGSAALYEGDLRRASEWFEESAVLHRELGAVPRVARSLEGLARVAHRQGENRRARELLAESMKMDGRVGHRSGFAESMAGLGVALIADEDPRRAARWLGFAHAVREEIGIVTYPIDKNAVDRLAGTLRQRLGDDFDAAFAAGRRATIEQILREVTAAFGEPGTPAQQVGPVALSAREREVAALVAEGLSNAAIAARLHISVRTAETHVQSIMNKIGAHSRTQIAVWLTRQSSP